MPAKESTAPQSALATRASRVAVLLKKLGASQWLEAEHLFEMQRGQLERLLRHAWHNVPFYREWLQQTDYSPDTPLTRAAFEALPVLTRAAVQEAGSRLHSLHLPPAHGDRRFRIMTSGSTGRAVQLQGTELTQLIWEALTLREHSWRARELRGRFAVIRWFEGDIGMDVNASPARSWGMPATLLFETGPCAVLNIRHATTTQADWLLRFDPDYLLSFPSQLAALAEHFAKHDLTLNRLREIRTIGESLSDTTRELCTRTWGVPVADIYSCEEAGYLAMQCREQGNYHIQSESVFLEIIDDAGRPCPPGRAGRVVISTPHNFATPLIRYEVGDYAELGEPCACGRGLPVLRRVLGRSRNRVILPNGESRFPYLGDRGDYRAITKAIRKFQFVQRSLEEIELKLVLAEPMDAAQEQRMKDLVRRNMGMHFTVTLSYHNEIPLSGRGKYEEFISLVPCL